MEDLAVRMKRKNSTIVAADVAGFSRLCAQAEEEVLQRLAGIRREIIDPVVREHGGRVIKTMGDGVLVEFSAPEPAVRASQQVQEMMADLEEPRAEEERIRFRVGINHGDVLVDGDDVLGDVVNVAARLESLSPPGGICVSRSVREMLAHWVDLKILPRGKQYVRNIPTPVEVWQVTTRASDQGIVTDTKRIDRPSVLVLPFDNLSGEADDEFLADGISEDVINALARFRSLFVIARGSSFIYRGRDVDLRQVSQDTGARYVVRGSVRRGGQRLRVSAQLIEAESGQIIWSDRYDRDIADIFDLQDDITSAVVTGITPEIGAHERNLARTKPTESLSAWEMCQRGLANFDRRTTAGMKSAYDLFHAAVEADETYALPHALLGRLHAVRVFSGRSLNLPEDIGAGMKHATRAVQLDDRLEVGYQALAQLLLIQNREADARDALERAKALNDNDAFTYSAQTYINLFQPEPDCDEMEMAGLEALRLSPKDPLAWSYYWMLVMAVWMRENELGENVRHYLDPAARLPGSEAFVHVAVAVVALKRGDHQAAQQAVDRALDIRPELTLHIIRHAFHFPKWPELVAGVNPQLDQMIAMGLPEE